MVSLGRCRGRDRLRGRRKAEAASARVWMLVTTLLLLLLAANRPGQTTTGNHVLSTRAGGPASLTSYLATQESVGIDSCSAGELSKADWLNMWNKLLPWDNRYAPRTFFGYMGGENAASACGTAGWISASTESTANSMLPPGEGWGVGVIWDGLQAPSGCNGGGGQLMPPDPSGAFGDGENDGGNAMYWASQQNWNKVVYLDVENYSPSNTDIDGYNCEQVVTQYLSGWDYELQNVGGWNAGIYGSACSTIKGLIDYLGSTYLPNFIWPGSNTNSDWNVPCVGNQYWVFDQRSVQYYDGWSFGTQFHGSVPVDSDCVLSGVNDGLTASVWDTDAYNDGGSAEGSSQSDDIFC